MINYYVALNKKSGGHTFVKLDTTSLEETDMYIGSNFPTYQDLSKYIMQKGTNKGKTYNPYPFIKEVIKTSEYQRTNTYHPIYGVMDKKTILEYCKEVIENQKRDPNYYRFHRKEIGDIIKVFSKKEIEYEDIRECYFNLIQLEIPKRNLEIHDNKTKTR